MAFLCLLLTLLLGKKGLGGGGCLFLKWRVILKLSPAKATCAYLVKCEKCIASKVGGWIGGQNILFELYALVGAVYKGLSTNNLHRV